MTHHKPSLTEPPTPNPITRACQQLTQLWWHTRCDPAATFISDFVQREIKDGDPLRAMRRMAAVQNLVSLQENDEVESMKELLICGGGLTAKAHLVTPFELMENSYETIWRRNSS